MSSSWRGPPAQLKVPALTRSSEPHTNATADTVDISRPHLRRTLVLLASLVGLMLVPTIDARADVGAPQPLSPADGASFAFDSARLNVPFEVNANGGHTYLVFSRSPAL